MEAKEVAALLLMSCFFLGGFSADRPVADRERRLWPLWWPLWWALWWPLLVERAPPTDAADISATRHFTQTGIDHVRGARVICVH